MENLTHDELVARDTLKTFQQALQALWTLQALDDDTLGNLSGNGKLFGQLARQVEERRNRYYCGHVDGVFDIPEKEPDVM